MLQEKLNSYIAFVESGQLSRLEHPPIPPNPDVRVTLAVQHAPSEPALEFFGQVRDFLRQLGIGFDWELRGQDEID